MPGYGGRTLEPKNDMSDSSIAPAPAQFSLLDDVIVLSNAAMRAGEPAKAVEALVKGLNGLLAGPLEVPAWLLETQSDEHARRELYRSREYGYEVIAITWAPGQESTVHNHGDTWGVESVLRGRLEVTDYRLKAQHRALSELEPAGTHMLEAGSVIGLLPPQDLHQCRNPDGDDVAVSLHVYGKHLEHVKRYTHVEGSLYRPQRVMLATV